MILLFLLLCWAALAAAQPVKVYTQCVRELDGLEQYEASGCTAESVGFEVFCINLKQTYRCDGVAWRKQ